MVVALSAIPHKAAVNFFQRLPAAECNIFSAHRACAENRGGGRPQCRKLPGGPTALGIMGDMVLEE